MSKRITNLEDARAMKAMGAPLNTERCEKLVVDTIKAAGRCRNAVYDYIDDQNASTYSKLLRAYKKLGREIAKTSDADGDDKPLAEEKEIARACVEPHCLTAYQKWADIIAALESGGTVRLTDDAWPWPTETDHALKAK